MAVTDLFARRATLRGRCGCSASSGSSRRDPARFYGALADRHRRAGHSICGGGARRRAGRPHAARRRRRPRLLRDGVRRRRAALRRRRTRPARDACRTRRASRGAGTFVRASGMALPFADDSVDICLSSNVAEHVREPWRLGDEMLRVTRPGGLVVLSYTVWLGPFGGHEMGLTHYLGGAPGGRAVRPQTRPSTQERLRLVVVRGLGRRRPASGRPAPARWSPHSPATTRDGRGGWSRVPVLREFTVSNLVLVLAAVLNAELQQVLVSPFDG